MKFKFPTDAESQNFCECIAREMASLFCISEDEAIGRMNKHWAGQSIVGQDIVYHEDKTYWAKRIYYEGDAKWWIPGAVLKPKPFP